MASNSRVIVIGSINTDIFATGLTSFPQAGQHVYARQIRVAAGGKSRNVAEMLSYLLDPGSVIMIGATIPDAFGLWEVPIAALRAAGTDITHIVEVPSKDADVTTVSAGVALILVHEEGDNEIILSPGASKYLTPELLDQKVSVFQEVSKQDGILCLGMEMPLRTIVHAVKLAQKHHLRVALDLGGMKPDEVYDELFAQPLFLVKPNEHEVQMATGIEVVDMATARAAAEWFFARKTEVVLITVGAGGAYLFSRETGGLVVHIPVPTRETLSLPTDSPCDETGCGDQTLAAMVAGILEGKSLQDAAAYGVQMGTVQFYRSGVVPVRRGEVGVLEKLKSKVEAFNKVQAN